MQLNPRYGTDPLITLDSPLAEILEARRPAPLTGHLARSPTSSGRTSRKRLVDRDVIVHLDSTNTFWTFSIAQA